MLTDFRTSVRLLRQAPGLAFAVVSTLALTIGANTAVFSVIDKVLVQASPVERPDRIVVIWSRERAAAGTIGEISYATFRRWQTEARGFQNLAAVGSTTWSLILREGDPATIPIAAVSASFFPLMGVVPSIGRTILPEDDRQGSARVAVMSHGSWVRRFGADPGIVGRSLRFQDAVYTIVGVMPEGFDYPRGAELWLPLVPQLADAGRQWNTDLLTDPRVGMLFVLGRLDPHTTLDAARDGVLALIAQSGNTTFRSGSEAVLTPLDEHIFGNIRPALVALAVCVGLVLLIGCANVAVLFLVRSATRARETAIRLAIGATRWSIVRQSLSDSLVLTTLGGVVGLGLAYWTVKILVGLAPADVPRLDSVRFDARTLAFTWTVCLITATFVGLAPGVQAARRDLLPMINGGGSRIVRSHRLRRAFVITQVALALALLVCAGLVGRSFVNLLRIDVGFNPSHVLTMDITIPDAPPERHNAFYQELLARVRAMAGVEAAGAVFLRPLEYSGIGQDAPLLIEGQRTDVNVRDWEQNPLVNLESVTPDYFRAIGIPIGRGRSFAETDTARAPRVAIVSENLARRLWPGEDAIGKRLLPPWMSPDEQGRPPWTTVVGVARNARYRGLTDPRFDLYLPHLQIPGVLVKHVMVRASGDPFALATPIRAEAHRLESSALVERVVAMEDIVAQATAPWRFSTWTLGLLSLLAMALASLGLYAVVSQTVVERTREIGVRVAIGALPREIVQLVLRDSVVLTLAGIGIGLIVALGVGRILTSLLFDVQLIDPSTLASVAALFIAVSTVAIIVPAWRGAHVDPVVALRHE
jgi:putative ABC transport system permease protein